jgi:hypothetical protein
MIMTNPEKPTLWASGVTFQDRLFLWHLSKLPLPYEIDPARLQDACQHCRYPMERALVIMNDFPRAWSRMLQKRHCILTGEPDPSGDTTPRRAANARMVGLLCNHPRMARKMRKAGVLA